MKIIRDEELCGIMMTPLFCSWGIKRCNVKDCKEQPSTILVGDNGEFGKAKRAGICEKHYQQGNKKGGTELIFEWN